MGDRRPFERPGLFSSAFERGKLSASAKVSSSKCHNCIAEQVIYYKLYQTYILSSCRIHTVLNITNTQYSSSNNTSGIQKHQVQSQERVEGNLIVRHRPHFPGRLSFKGVALKESIQSFPGTLVVLYWADNRLLIVMRGGDGDGEDVSWGQRRVHFLYLARYDRSLSMVEIRSQRSPLYYYQAQELLHPQHGTSYRASLQ